MRECPTCFSCYDDTVGLCPVDGRSTFHSLPGGVALEGKYVLERRLGEGGMGVVYKAHHKFLKTTRAIKIIRPELVGNDPSFATRFYQEAMAAAATNHPNIISVVDFGFIDEKIPYIVMEFIEGISLQELMTNEGQFTPEKALEYMRVIASGVGAAHAHGIVHRDLKPLNIMITRADTVREQIRILDFGLAKIKSDLFGSFVGAKTTGIIGSPYYMAPEQWSDEDTDKRCDVYSLGIILYQMLMGDVPFKGSSIPAIMKNHLMSPPPHLATGKKGITLQLERVVHHALEKQPTLRTASTEDLIFELEQAIFESAAAQVKSTTVRNKPKAKVDRLEETRPRELSGQEPNFVVQSATPEKVEAILAASEPDHGSFTIAQGHLTLHMDKKELNKLAQLHGSSTVALRYPEAFRHSEEHIFEQLILHKDYERLWRSLLHAGGGCNLLTGYGPFGGTTLVRCAIGKARDELNKTVHDQAALLVFYFSVVSENKHSFKLEATKFGLEQLNKSSAPRQDSGFNELRARAGQATDGQGSILNFPLPNPLGETFFNPKTLTHIEKPKDNYDFSNLVDDLNAYFREQKNSRALRQIISSLVRSEFLPSRVVFIVDRIKYLETLEALAASDFFSNKRIRVIAVSRQEELDTWSDADNRLEAIKFAKWYVPCLWEIDFDKVLFKLSSGGLLVPKYDLRVFVKHLEFKGRGSFGNIMKELRHGRNINYGEHTNFIDLKYLAGRTDVRHNAWLQGLLDTNWDVLLSDHFVGVDQEEKQDRARIAIYYLLDWISQKGRFIKAEILEQASKTRITISDDAEIRTEATETLLYVLSNTRYLVKKGLQYRISWNANRTATAFERPGRSARALRLRTLTHVAGARRLADQPQAGVPALSRGRLEFTVENEEEAHQRTTRAALAARCAQ
jgi:serine/threonine protein kinase